LRIVVAGHRIVNRTGADDDKNPRIIAVEDALDDFTAVKNGLGGSRRYRQPAENFSRRRHKIQRRDIEILEPVGFPFPTALFWFATHRPLS
jgi:hypothetical protein